ncbi:hypothetical protein BOTBODRAFT_26194 [Botryobasidium botryosum FD-172 SS1]|uniref:Uncharacterized protein n=1 Tax=Botryobasidium botryosum (strain FD-172 SS1) TaxID=930990 RepID=A0A067NCC8_BOTB1|nr:hypothetical protein BOTBODRAFT_26194 [Botryobasidium botryosum FD-172 SS1]
MTHDDTHARPLVQSPPTVSCSVHFQFVCRANVCDELLAPCVYDVASTSRSRSSLAALKLQVPPWAATVRNSLLTTTIWRHCKMMGDDGDDGDNDGDH